MSTNRRNTRPTRKGVLFNLEEWRARIQEYIQSSLMPHKDKEVLDIGHGLSLQIIKGMGIKVDCLDKNSFSGEIKYVMSILDSEAIKSVPQYDIVSCCEVLEHTESMETTARNVMSLVKPGGFALITVPCYLPHHPGGHYYGDYYRVMPTGLNKLFTGYKVTEKVYPSELDGMPYGIGAIVQK